MPLLHVRVGRGPEKTATSALALLVAAGLGLGGCVSSKGDPVADIMTPDSASVEAASTTRAPADPASPTAEYASAASPADTNASAPAASPPAADMSGAVMAGTGINANRSSIFAMASPAPAVQTEGSPEAASGPSAAAGFNATNASFFSASGKNPLLASAGSDTSAEEMEMDDVPLILRGKLYSSTDLGPDPNDTPTDMVTMASLPSMTRQSVTGLLVQNPTVETSCFKPRLVNMLREAEAHFGKRIVVTSGFRDPEHNHRVGGAKHSQHLSCDAADIQMVGVSKWDLARYFRARADIGGVGTYCSTNSIHVDIGRRRDWNWKCRSDTEL